MQILIQNLDRVNPLFRPTRDEVNIFARQALGKSPRLHGAMQAAVNIVTGGRFNWDGDDWIFEGDEAGEFVQASHKGCTCSEYVMGEHRAAGRPWCRHTLAVSLYRLVLEAHLERLEASGRIGVEWVEDAGVLSANNLPTRPVFIFPRREEKRGILPRWALISDGEAVIFAHALDSIIGEQVGEPVHALAEGVAI